ncbi:MAG: hypothetical protein HAW62_03735 [Endozoicomonadaceae bacterium]|nr:hypothetical protein [Endozoicomonadaceae bacterium]
MNRHAKAHQKQIGLLLIEMMISMALSVSLLYIMLQNLSVVYKNKEITQKAMDLYNNKYQISEILSYDIRMAGYKGCSGKNQQVIIGSTIPNDYQLYNMTPNIPIQKHDEVYSPDVFFERKEIFYAWSIEPDVSYVLSHDTNVTEERSILQINLDSPIFLRDDLDLRLLLISSCQSTILVKPTRINKTSAQIEISNFLATTALNAMHGPIEVLISRPILYTVEQKDIDSVTKMYSQIMNIEGLFTNKQEVARLNDSADNSINAFNLEMSTFRTLGNDDEDHRSVFIDSALSVTLMSDYQNIATDLARQSQFLNYRDILSNRFGLSFLLINTFRNIFNL